MKTYELIGSAGCGSAIVEMALVLANVPHTLTDVPYHLKPGPERRIRLLQLDPLGQVPTLVTPEGEVMTESAAMIPHLSDVAPRIFAPSADNLNGRTLNVLLRLVGAVYPTFTYGDPSWADEGAAADLLRGRARCAWRAELWKERAAGGSPHVEPFRAGPVCDGDDTLASRAGVVPGGMPGLGGGCQPGGAGTSGAPQFSRAYRR